MNILGHHTGNLNELVFENRNKNYGAYAIRENYNSAIVKSLGSLVGLLLLLFGSVYSYNHFNRVEIDDKLIDIDAITPPTIIETVIDVTPPTPPSQPETATAAPLGATTPTAIIDNVVETTSVTTIDNNPHGLGNENSQGTSGTSTISGTSTVVAVTVNTMAVIDNSPVVITAEMPEFNSDPNGILKYVSGNLYYPEGARVIGIEGTVHVSFVVNEIGLVESVKVLKGIGYGCDEEVVRIINKMPKWKKPGKNENGQPVKVRYNIPVKFKLK